ncbi:hypothetical protein [Halosimplex amylolyticum]|uniref:hypothetical protein n=1 Tax=Halosimplex amylolyticum TaxID=3396616 RepID=UPI003F553B88
MSGNLSLAVSKRLVTDEYAYPSVRLRVSIGAGEPVAVRLVESLPPGVDETAVGFHADEGYEHWSVAGGGRIVYEDVVRESQPVSTLYGIADADPDQLAACLDLPTVEIARTDDLDAVDAADWIAIDDERIDASIGDADGGYARPADRQTSPTGGDWGGSETTMNQNEERTNGEQDGESIERDERTEQDEQTERDERTEQDEQTERDERTEQDEQTECVDESSEQPGDPEPGVGDGEAAALTRGGTAADCDVSTPTDRTTEPGASAPDESTGPAVPTQPEPHDSVVERFAEELRRDEPSSQAVATLRSHLGADTSGSVDAKLDHCMTRIGELDAYVDALEAFLDDEGTAEQVLGEVRDDLRTVEAHVEDVERRVESVEKAQSRLDNRLASVEADLDEVAELDHAVDDLDATVTETRAELTDAVAEVEAEVAALGDDLESVEEWRSTVVQALSAAQDSAPADDSDAG